MKKLLLGMIVLVLAACPLLADETETLLKKVNAYGRAMAMVRCEVKTDLGSQAMTGLAVCIHKDSSLFMTQAISPQIDPEQITQLQVIPSGSPDKRMDAELLSIDPLTSLAFFQVKGDHAWEQVRFQPSAGVSLGDKIASVGLYMQNPGLPVLLGQAYVACSIDTPGRVYTTTGGRLGPMGSVVFDSEGRAIGLAMNPPFGRYQMLGQQGTVNMAIKNVGEVDAFMPVEEFVHILKSIPRDKKVRRMPWVGVGQFSPVTDIQAKQRGIDTPAVQIDKIIPGYPAAKKGLKARDLIIAMDGKPLEAMPTPALVRADFVRKLLRKNSGESVKLTVLSGTQRREVEVPLEPMPKLPREARRYMHRGLGFIAREKVMLDQFLGSGPSAEIPGLVVQAVGENTLAGQAGLQNGDLILSINGTAVTEAGKAKELVDASVKARTDIRMEVQRDAEQQTVVIRLPQEEQ